MGKQPVKSGSTISAIAKEAGVSTATVSRVFNRSTLVRDDVAERILRIAEEKKFTPRQATRLDTLVLVIENAATSTYSSYVATILKELVQSCAEFNLRLDIVSADQAGLIRGKYIMGAIGLLWKPASLMRFAQISDTRLVSLNEDTSTTSICADEAQGMRLAVDYLASRGHRRIGLLARNVMSYGDRERIRHFDALMEQRLNEGFEPTTIVFDGTCNDLLVGLAKTFRKGRHEGGTKSGLPTALIAPCEETGIQLMHDLDILGILVPSEVSVISHEAPEQSAYLIPSHTTVAQNYRALVGEAVKWLRSPAPSGAKGQTKKILVPFTLIERDSVTSLSPSKLPISPPLR